MAEVALRERVSFQFVRYANVWEDADVLCEALAPVAAGGRLLSIASAGDNTLALLTLDPKEVVAVDLSPAQLACLELRVAAFRRLADPELLAFLGLAPSSDRLATYCSLRRELSGASRSFWDAHEHAVRGGVIHAGKFERYLRSFRRFVLPLIHSGRQVEQLCEPRPPGERARFYDRTWDTWRWRCLFRLFFSRAVMGRLGRDPAFFQHVSADVGSRLLARTRRALTELPLSSNPFLAYILTGNCPAAARPRYLRAEFTDRIRGRLDRLRLVEGRVERTALGPFDGFNLSDVFEYMSPSEHEQCYEALLDQARPGARLAYWNLLVSRACPACQGHRVRALDPLAAELHARDRAWFYQSFRIDEVIGGGET